MQTARIRLMHALIIAVSLAGFAMVIGCGQAGTSAKSKPKDTSSKSKPKECYSGGTLHDKTIADWRAATYENRLATCADFVMKLGKYESLPADLKERATQLEICISKAAESGLGERKVAEFGAVCAVYMGYRN